MGPVQKGHRRPSYLDYPDQTKTLGDSGERPVSDSDFKWET